ncbi:HAUS6 [Bugula neritina]|uniref:HAUS6 n=1 Tax=Bugula neritina TaxID=10212 RepID=A0A7J7IZA4_BUGNE|nr:HAUS6 [Bugula neritina]
MSTYDHKRQIFYTNLLLLGYDQSFAQTHGIHKVAFNVDMFKLPNKAGFEVVIYFLFHRLDPQRSAAEFRSCWPVRDKKAEQTFRKVCNGWLCQIAQDEPDAHLPKIVPSIFQSPGGERFCNLLLAFSTYVLSTIIKAENGVSAVDMLLRPILTPQNIEYAAAMVKGTHCMVINGRKRFFDSIHNRETLHKTWQSSAKDMLTEYRRLSKKIRETEANVKDILSNHGDRGISSPARSDRNRKSLTSASKHGRIFDVNIQSVRREEKIQKVRDLWSSVEDFLASSDTQQEVVSSILSGVVHKYILRASDLDIRIPEMLLRECERELLKRDISNTYKAGKLDLVSILNLWNLSMHLYLERFEECDVIDLSKQLEDLQPKVNALNQQLDSSRTLANSLRTQLIPELKESSAR